MSATAPMLELTGVAKRYGDVNALGPLDIAFASGRTYALLGTSGCGKSTLLKAALGLIRLDSGRVRLSGQQLTHDNVLQLRRRIGYVIQDGGLFPHLPVRDNVSLVARHLGWDASRIEVRLAELAELTRLPTDALGRYPAQLSGGQQQRVGLMRALMLDPDLLLLDEPLGALDPLIRSALQNDLRQIFRTLQKTVVLVTHDVYEAAWLADEILLLRGGRLLQRGPIADLIDSPQDPFVTEFISAQRTALPDKVLAPGGQPPNGPAADAGGPS